MYAVIDNSNGQTLSKQLTLLNAMRYVDILNGLIPDEIFSIHHTEEDNLPNQTITVYGNAIGYQFNRNSNGYRTVTRTVRHIRFDNGVLVGQIKYNDNVITVTHNAGNAWRVS